MSDPADNGDAEGGFLSGWSRRKRMARQQEAEARAQQADAPQTETLPDDADDEDAPRSAEAAEAAKAAEADLIAALPSLDDITAGSDISPFMARGVPPSLKNAALRKLWMASPLVRDYADPAVDYAWDWNAPGGVPGGGGTLSEQSVARMVKDLIGAKPKPGEDSAAGDVPGETAEGRTLEASAGADPGPKGDPGSDARADATLSPDPEAEGVAPAADPSEPVSVRLSGAGHKADATRQEAEAEPQARKHAALAPAARRHGGAVPE